MDFPAREVRPVGRAKTAFRVRTEDFYDFPGGPRSPVAILWMQRVRPGDGIHRATIGRAGIHGSIRLANWDAAALIVLAP
jgi:lipoprotein-anchoring transpeptidase ErfK/SrfK